jgi:hypothetical protein
MRLQVRQQRYPLADLLDTFDRDRYPASRATASKCRYMLVEPPIASVMMSRGRMPASISRSGRRPKRAPGPDIGVKIAVGPIVGWVRAAARQHHADRHGDRAHRVGREHLAAPLPGITLRSISSSSVSEIRLASLAARASA